ncbi:hypothetical protein [Lysobacter sp. CA199]|uniref:hypothetical protein n=1 Tax=Lysobacter sp. CA199 TaxID=3455608 RepID=UPI003F8CFA65
MKNQLKFALLCAFLTVSTTGMTASAATTTPGTVAAQDAGGGFWCLLITDEEWRYRLDCN